MEENLKSKTVSGMMWSAVGKVGTLTINFISNLVLARLLMPEDFGCIAMLSIFLAVSNIFIHGGLGAALIQKKEADDADYSTVFYWNLTFSAVFYAILYLIAPWVADYYGLGLLKPLLRVQSVVLVIQSLAIVQYTKLQKQMNFRALAIRNIAAAAAGTAVSIPLAFAGFGAWSLVASAITAAVVNVILLWLLSPWRPRLVFSFSSLKELFSFGGLMLLSSLTETLYTNLQQLIIGKRFSADTLGQFSQAKKLEEIPVAGLASIVNDVTFPAFSKLQDDKERLLAGVRKSTAALAFLNFPMMVLLAVIAEPLILLLYGGKWLPSVPYFRILCLAGLIYSINTLNTNVIKSLGEGKIYFLLQITKRVIGIAMIFAGIRLGIYGLLFAVAGVSYISFFINTVANRRLINYGLVRQVRDMLPAFMVSAVSGAAAFAVSFTNLHVYVVMSLQICIFAAIYLTLSGMLDIDGFRTYKSTITDFIKKKRQ